MRRSNGVGRGPGCLHRGRGAAWGAPSPESVAFSIARTAHQRQLARMHVTDQVVVGVVQQTLACAPGTEDRNVGWSHFSGFAGQVQGAFEAVFLRLDVAREAARLVRRHAGRNHFLHLVSLPPCPTQPARPRPRWCTRPSAGCSTARCPSRKQLRAARSPRSWQQLLAARRSCPTQLGGGFRVLVLSRRQAAREQATSGGRGSSRIGLAGARRREGGTVSGFFLAEAQAPGVGGQRGWGHGYFCATTRLSG